MLSWKTTSIVLGAILAAVLVTHHVQIRDLQMGTATKKAPKTTRSRALKRTQVKTDSSLEDRLEALEKKLAQLEPSTPRKTKETFGQATQETPEPAELATKIKTMEETLASALEGGSLDTEEGRTRLGAFVREQQSEAWNERRQEWRERRKKEEGERLSVFAKEAGLSEGQLEEVNLALETEREQRTELFTKARSGEISFGQARTQGRAMREATDTQAAEILDSTQLEAYTAMREEGRRGGWGH